MKPAGLRPPARLHDRDPVGDGLAGLVFALHDHEVPDQDVHKRYRQLAECGAPSRSRLAATNGVSTSIRTS